MTNRHDPRLVRDVAREAMRLAAQRRDDIDIAIARLGGLGNRPEDREGLQAYRIAYSTLYDAVRTEMRSAEVAVSWPDEPQDEREFAWHELRAFSGPSTALGADADYELIHAAQCDMLPPGAVCWAEREPMRWWWPTAHGIYRIRPEGVATAETTLHVQVCDKPGTRGQWIDYDGKTAGDEPDRGDNAAIAERIRVMAAEKAEQEAAAQAEHDADVRAVAEACAGVVDGTVPQPIRHEYAVRRLRKRFADRIVALDEADVAGGGCRPNGDPIWEEQ